MFKSKLPTGNVLLLALMMMASAIIGALGISFLVVSQLRQAKAIDNSMAAYVSAEGGLEQSLYDIRKTSLCDTGCTIENENCLTSLSDAKCQRTIKPAEILSLDYLAVDDIYQLDLGENNAITKVNITSWEAISAVDADKPQLEVSYMLITDLPDLDNPDSKFKVYRPNSNAPYECVHEPDLVRCNPIVLDKSVIPNQNDTIYQIRFRALDAPIKNMRISIEGGGLQNYYTVQAFGTKNNTEQSLTAQVPKNAPAYGLADYVIFSEQDIIK